MNKPKQYLTYNEIFDQKNSIRKAFKKYSSAFSDFSKEENWLLDEDEENTTVFTGCGSSYYLSQCLSACFNKFTKYASFTMPASEVFISSDSYFKKDKKYILVPISRSATTTETVEASRFFKDKIGGKIISINCRLKPPLSKIADMLLFEESAMDESIVMTKSFSTMLFIGLMMTAYVGKHDKLRLEIEQAADMIGKIVDDSSANTINICKSFKPQKVFFLGNGPFFGISSEAMLKMKEMSLTSSENYHFLEFRHGPMSMVDKDTMMVGLISKNGAKHQVSVLSDMKKIGAKVFVICDKPEDIGGFSPDWAFFIRSGMLDEVNCLLALPSLQFLALYHSVNKGLDVDKPRNLVKVVKI